MIKLTIDSNKAIPAMIQAHLADNAELSEATAERLAYSAEFTVAMFASSSVFSLNFFSLIAFA